MKIIFMATAQTNNRFTFDNPFNSKNDNNIYKNSDRFQLYVLYELMSLIFISMFLVLHDSPYYSLMKYIISIICILTVIFSVNSFLENEISLKTISILIGITLFLILFIFGFFYTIDYFYGVNQNSELSYDENNKLKVKESIYKIINSFGDGLFYLGKIFLLLCFVLIICDLLRKVYDKYCIDKVRNQKIAFSLNLLKILIYFLVPTFIFYIFQLKEVSFEGSLLIFFLNWFDRRYVVCGILNLIKIFSIAFYVKILIVKHLLKEKVVFKNIILDLSHHEPNQSNEKVENKSKNLPLNKKGLSLQKLLNKYNDLITL
jgi:hypothetical protein